MSLKNSLISLVVPFYNESESAPILYKELEEVRKKWNLKMEYIFVDDGSQDDSFEKLLPFTQENINLKLLKLRRNYGKSKALFYGISHSKGEAVLTMDADLQDNPEDIICLIEKLDEGYDLVGGWKKNRKDSFAKVFPSRVFNWLVRLVTRTRFHDINCGLKAYRKWVLENFTFRGELHRFPMIMAESFGANVTEIPVNHRPRKYGLSKFGIERFLRGALDIMSVLLLTRYLERPLHFFAKPGLVFIFFGGIVLIKLLVEHIYYLFTGFAEYQLVIRPLLIISTILIVSGIQITSIGFILEYILMMKDRKIDFPVLIKEKINVE